MRSKQKQPRRNSQNKSLHHGQSILNRKIVAPEKLKILVLAGNQLLNDHLDFLGKCINLIKLDLSHNQITKFSQKHSLQPLNKLEVVFLHNNKIATLEALHPLYSCLNITFLTYHHNPLQVHVKNQHEIVNSFAQLKLINSRIVYVEERADFMMHERPPVFAQTQMLENWKSNQNSEAYYLKVLNLQLQYIDNLWAFNNPIIFIQRAWRHFLPPIQQHPIPSAPSSHYTRSNKSKLTTRKRASRSRNESGFGTRAPHPLAQWFNQWKKFSCGLKSVKSAMKKCKQNGVKVDKSYMLYSMEQYNRQLRNMRVSDPLRHLLAKIRRKIYQRKMAQRLRADMILKRSLFAGQLSFYNISGIQSNSRLYYNKNQQHLIDNFLHIIAENFNMKQLIEKECSFQASKQFSAIRLVDPESFANKYRGEGIRSLCCLIWPSMKVVVCNRKKVASKFRAGIIGIRQLSYLKNRDKVISKAQLKKSIEVFKRLQKFAANQYENSMWHFTCQNQFIFRQLIRMIYYHNCKAVKFQVKSKKSEVLSLLENYQQPFILYVDKVLKRTVAAVVIQKSWRRFLSNKNQKESIYYQMKKNRAALHIQRFIRNSHYRHRQYFSKKITYDLGLLKTPTILYPLSLYLNLSMLVKDKVGLKLFKNLKITRAGSRIGMSEQFYRPLFQKKIRDIYFKGQELGKQSDITEINLYNLFHYNTLVSIVERNGNKFISITYSSEVQANIVASIIALLTYQMRTCSYVWPLSKSHPQDWENIINEYSKVSSVKPYIEKFKKQEDQMGVVLKSIDVQERGLFVWKSQQNLIKQTGVLQINHIFVQFYQKKYHNFPLKHQQKLKYVLFNQKTEQQVVQTGNYKAIKQHELPISKTISVVQQGPLNITMIDKKRFSLFEQSQKSIKNSEEKISMGKTMGVLIQDKRQKVFHFYKEECMRREAQKQVKQINLTGIREKAKQQKMLNTTLKSLKEAERTEGLRSKVQRIKQMKQKSVHKRVQQDFIQQNNFVMEQQLKMVIMRQKLKDAQHKREQFLTKKSSVDKQSDHYTPSVHSRKSSRQKQRFEEIQVIADQNQTQVIGEEGSVINVKKRIKKTRAQSIGAYIRDPSFVHGVFPQEYYPIQSRATSFYFPPVV